MTTTLPDHDVLTIEEVSSFLRVRRESLQSEIDAGRLPALSLAGERRILRTDLLDFLETAKTQVADFHGSEREEIPRAASAQSLTLELRSAEPFEHIWPDRKKESFTNAYEGSARNGKEVRPVRTGFTERSAAGRMRKRAVIFIDKRPLVEFVAADDFDRSQLMVSRLKTRDGKELRPSEPIPAEYSGFRIEAYRDHVTGPYASTNLAIVCPSTDRETMVKHALLRLRSIEIRARKRSSKATRRSRK